jgi:hypothetical protein
MAPLPPLKPDQQASLRSRAAMLATTAMARIGLGASERTRDAEPAGGAPAISLAATTLRIEDGLLMAFGPEGDPIPPAAFAALAADQPDAEIALEGGARAPAQRIAAVLAAQAKGTLTGAQGERAGGEAWIKAMLGLGPQPVLAGEAELRGEDRTCELTIFGRELMLAMPGGRSFLITDADPGDPAATSLALLSPEGQALSVADLVERVRAEVAQRPPANPAAGAASQPGAVHRLAEVVLSGCAIARASDGLLLELPAVGAVRLTRLDLQAPDGPRVSIVRRDGEATDLASVTAALAGTDVRERGNAPAAEAEPSPTPTDAGEPDHDPSGRAVRVSLSLPRPEGVDADRIVVVILHGMPAGGALSAGIDDGHGRWVLSPRQLAGLTLTPPPGSSEHLALELTAIAVRNRAGEFVTARESVVVALDGPAETVLPLSIDPAIVRDGGPTPSALMIRGVPAGARLSAGTYDPATAGWVLRPDQLGGLTVATPIGQQGFTLTVLGISLAAGGRAEARVLTRLPVATR